MKEKFLSRRRKFTPRNLFLSVLNLTASTNNDGYFSALSRTWQSMGKAYKETPAKSSLSEYRSKVAFTFFRDIFDQSLQRLEKTRKTYRGYHVYAIDGDYLELPASKDVARHGFRGLPISKTEQTHYPRMYTVQAVDIINGMVKAFAHDTRINEVALARQMVGQLEKNSITIYDRYHYSYRTVLNHAKNKNFFLLRVSDNREYLQENVKSFCRSEKLETRVELVPHKNEPKYLKLPEVEVRLVRVKNPRSKKSIVLMTNLPKVQFSRKELGRLYQRRWEVETSFRDLTQTLKMCQWHSTKINGILQEIYALLWLVNSCRMKCAQITKTAKNWLEQEYTKSNFKLCVNLVVTNLDLLLERKWRQLDRLLTYWVYRSSENREHLSRYYPRIIKRSHDTYPHKGVVPRFP